MANFLVIFYDAYHIMSEYKVCALYFIGTSVNAYESCIWTMTWLFITLQKTLSQKCLYSSGPQKKIKSYVILSIG